MQAKQPVIFVGAGPGDPELITVKGRRALAEADLVLYAGSLVNRAILDYVRPEAAIQDTASMDLDAMVRRMIEEYRAGRLVVRLHSGDPGVFGAVREQVVRLQQDGVPSEIIPGVTAASAVAAALGREMTVPEVTQTVILTRTAGRTPVPEREALAELARHGSTMAIYLSIQQVESVVESLLPHYGPEAPVVVAYRISWPDERVLEGTLSGIVDQVHREGIRRQALILVGPSLEKRAGPSSKLYDRRFSHGFRKASTD